MILHNSIKVLLALTLLTSCQTSPSNSIKTEDSVKILRLESQLIQGRWIFDAQGQAVKGRPERRERGLQTSGLVARSTKTNDQVKTILWSVGDQRSEFAGQLFQIDPKKAWLSGSPIPLILPEKLDREEQDFPQLHQLRAWPNPDFEGLATHPNKPNTLIAITEDRQSWLLSLELETQNDKTRARLTQLTEVKFPKGTQPYKEDKNFRLEGITSRMNSEGELFLAYERHEDGLPKIFKVKLPQKTKSPFNASTQAQLLNIDLSQVGFRPGKGRARLNFNGLTSLKWMNREWLLAVARDQERLVIIDVEKQRVTSTVDLHLRSPNGLKMLWVSPEGVALNLKENKLWIVNDPDSVRGNYRLQKNEKAQGHFESLVPQLFELELKAVLPK